VTSNIALDYDVTEFKLVTFLDIPESFDVDNAGKRSEMIVHYVIGKTLYASRHDFVGLYKVGIVYTVTLFISIQLCELFYLIVTPHLNVTPVGPEIQWEEFHHPDHPVI